MVKIVSYWNIWEMALRLDPVRHFLLAGAGVTPRPISDSVSVAVWQHGLLFGPTV